MEMIKVELNSLLNDKLSARQMSISPPTPPHLPTLYPFPSSVMVSATYLKGK